MSEKTAFEKWKDSNHEKIQKEKEEIAKKIMEKPVKPWDLLNPNVPRSTEFLAEERFKICLSCPELINFTKQCKKCGCFMAAKTKLEAATCPIGKW
jgi:broad specificity polyphosphatase/5'/3'-nucleotidase SurE